MLDAENVLVEELYDGHIRVNGQKGLLPVTIAQEQVGFVEA